MQEWTTKTNDRRPRQAAVSHGSLYQGKSKTAGKMRQIARFIVFQGGALDIIGSEVTQLTE
jgi:hypothetical protein